MNSLVISPVISLKGHSKKGQGRSYRACLIAIVLSIFLSGCDVELFSELDERNANDILLALNQGGIAASKSLGEPGKWQISVKSDAVQEALATVNRHGLPRAQFVSLGEVFAKDGLIATPAEERQRYAFAVSQELSNTLMQIDGVVVARVHPVIPVMDPLSERIPTPSAAVFIKHLQSADLGPMVPAIKRLVSQSIEGLDPDNVALTFSAASVAPIEPNREPAEMVLIETSDLMIGGGLVLAALVCWPIARLSPRSAGNTSVRNGRDSRHEKEHTLSNRCQSFMASINQWLAGLRQTKKPGHDDGDGWNG